MAKIKKTTTKHTPVNGGLVETNREEIEIEGDNLMDCQLHYHILQEGRNGKD